MQTITHNCEQGTPEWFALRLGRMTASHAQAIGSCGKGLDTLCMELAAERLSGKVEESYTNEDIERGKALEAQARTLYEWETGKDIKQVGFISYGDYSGCSPDGLFAGGGIEIKCPKDTKYLEVVLDNFVEPKYIWQMQMQMLITGAKSWDYVVFNSNFKRCLHVIPVVADEKKQAAILEGLAIGEKKIKEIIAKMEGLK